MSLKRLTKARGKASRSGLRKGDRVRPSPEGTATFPLELNSGARGTVTGRTRGMLPAQIRVLIDRKSTPKIWDERWWDLIKKRA